MIKNFWNKKNPNVYRGMAPFVDNDASHIEIFEVGTDFSKVSPEEQDTPLHEETPFPLLETE